MKLIVVAIAVSSIAGNAHAAPAKAKEECKFNGPALTVLDSDHPQKRVSTRLVAELVDPPRVRVTLSVDDPQGVHKEITWDPAVGDGLLHDIVLPRGTYHIAAFAEDDVHSTQSFIVTTSWKFAEPEDKKGQKGTTLELEGTRRVAIDSASGHAPASAGTAKGPRLELRCGTPQVEMSDVRLNTKRLYGVAVARGLLDQAAPSVVKDTLTILSEIAIEKAKAGALELVREQFVTPLCSKLNLALFGLGETTERAFPRVCDMLQTTRLEDLLSSGRSLIDAAKDDVRRTVIPRVIDRVDMPPFAREVAKLALQIGNEMIDGTGSHTAELDLVVAELDRIFSNTAAASMPSAQALAYDALGIRKRLIHEVLELALPSDPSALLSQYIPNAAVDVAFAKSVIAKVPSCVRLPQNDTPKRGVPVDRTKCLDDAVDYLNQQNDWYALILSSGKIRPDAVRAVAKSLVPNLDEQLGTWVEEQSADPDSELMQLVSAAAKNAPEALKAACAVRVVIGVVKWCSGKDSCSAGDIAAAIDDPTTIFKPTTSGPDSVCWSDGSLQLPAVRTKYIELASRAVAFLVPPAKGEELKRMDAMLRWMFDLAKAVEGESTKLAALESVEEVLTLIEQRDYVRAISQALTFANRVRGNCENDDCPANDDMRQALSLLGAVASYLQIYDETKSMNAAEAKEARKKALETLIDSATDRTSRAGEKVWSVGIPVGVSGGWRWTPGTSTRGYATPRFRDAFESERTFGLRVPLVFARQRLPKKDSHVGSHVSLTFADLGNFTRGSSHGQDDSVRWGDFLQFGAMFGPIFGTSKHAVVFAFDVDWSPGLYQRDVVIMNADGTTRTRQLSGALFVGAMLTYYVPLFDFH